MSSPIFTRLALGLLVVVIPPAANPDADFAFRVHDATAEPGS